MPTPCRAPPTGAILGTLARSIRHQASDPPSGSPAAHAGREPVLADMKELTPYP
jgi:hypothetical protein